MLIKTPKQQENTKYIEETAFGCRLLLMSSISETLRRVQRLFVQLKEFISMLMGVNFVVKNVTKSK